MTSMTEVTSQKEEVALKGVPSMEDCEKAVKVLQFMLAKDVKGEHQLAKIDKLWHRKVRALARQYTEPYHNDRRNKHQALENVKQERRKNSGLELSSRKRQEKYRALYNHSAIVNVNCKDKEKSDCDEKYTQKCYICKSSFEAKLSDSVFYEQLCLPCNQFQYAKRIQTMDLCGTYALVTGARIKIGFETALKLLRAGVFVIGTTRYAQDANKRFRAETDFETWKDRLHLYGLDFLCLKDVSRFVQHMQKTYPSLHYLINNACQTIQKPMEEHKYLLAEDQKLALVGSHSQEKHIIHHIDDQRILQTVNTLENDIVQFDVNHLPVNKRLVTSWQLMLPNITLTEFAECQVINVTVPFLLIQSLTDMMEQSAHTMNRKCYIINVSSMEGQFQRRKTDAHPHLNAMKAAMNMITRTSGQSYLEKHGIRMLSVDTGWADNYKPVSQQQGWRNPVDYIDGAARILDPIFTQCDLSGFLLKDYRIAPW